MREGVTVITARAVGFIQLLLQLSSLPLHFVYLPFYLTNVGMLGSRRWRDGESGMKGGEG